MWIVLIKPFVFRVEGRDGDVYDSHFSYGPVAAAGLDEDCGQRRHRHAPAVQLHFASPFEDEVYFGQLLVVVHAGIDLDIDHVHRGRGVVGAQEGPFGKAARALHRVNLIESCNHVIGHILPFTIATNAKLKILELRIGLLYILLESCDLIKS